MKEFGFDELVCEDCGEPLFLSKDECKNFIETKMKEGFIVCGCCSAKNKPLK